MLGTRTKHPVQHRIIGVVAGADGQLVRCTAFCHPVNDLRLSGRQFRCIAFHVIKQDRQIGDTQLIKRCQFLRQRGFRRAIEIVEHLERAQANAEPDSVTATKPGEISQLIGLRLRMRLVPPAPEKSIRLGCVPIVPITMGSQCRNQLPTLFPAPQRAIEAFDDSQWGLLCHWRFHFASTQMVYRPEGISSGRGGHRTSLAMSARLLVLMM